MDTTHDTLIKPTLLAVDDTADNLALLTDFDPEAVPGSEVPDPWYGSASGFEGTLAAVEAGLAAGDKVVVDGLDKLKDGVKVEAIDPKAVDAPGRESKRGAGRPGH